MVIGHIQLVTVAALSPIGQSSTTSHAIGRQHRQPPLVGCLYVSGSLIGWPLEVVPPLALGSLRGAPSICRKVRGIFSINVWPGKW